MNAELPRRHVIVKIPFHDLDPVGIVWHGNYTKYFEIARCELLQSFNYNYDDMMRSGYMWPIIDMRLRYVKSARFGEETIEVNIPAGVSDNIQLTMSGRGNAGAKGGRARDVPIATDEQRELLARVMSAVAPGEFVGRPGFTTTQNQARFYYVIRKFGISKAGLGVVAHGLRHQYANDHFEDDAGGRSPVRGGKVRPPGNDIARRRVARALGHNRGRASTAYIGSDSGLPGTPTDSTPDQSGDVSG